MLGISEAFDQTDPGPKPAKDYEGVSTSPRKAVKNLIEMSGEAGVGKGRVTVYYEVHGFELFGVPVEIPPYMLELTALTPVFGADIKEELSKDSDEPVQVTWHGTEHTIRTTRPPTAEEMQRERELRQNAQSAK